MHFRRTKQLLLHEALAVTPQLLRNFVVHPNTVWDLRVPPEHAYLAATSQYLPAYVLQDHATEPPLTAMRITSGLFAAKEWVIEVRNPYGVTVQDVLVEIHQALRHRITQKEWAHRSHQQQVFMADAFHRRIRLSTHPKAEMAQGVRRIDWLLDHTVFAGLQPSAEAPFTWTLLTKKSAG